MKFKYKMFLLLSSDEWFQSNRRFDVRQTNRPLSRTVVEISIMFNVSYILNFTPKTVIHL